MSPATRDRSKARPCRPRGGRPQRRRLALAAVALVAIHAGCDRPPNDAGAAIAVVDDAGRTVALPAPATRIVSLIPAVTDVILALDAEARLVARTRYDTDPRISALPSLEDALTPSVEWIVARAPDLVIAWPDRQSRSVVTRLDELGVPVYASTIETLADMRRGMRNVGTLLGLAARADSLIAGMDDAIASVRHAVAGRDVRDVLYLIGLDPPMSAGPGSFVHELIEIAGGRNIMDDATAAWPPVSVEEIVAREPDLVLLATAGAREPVLERLREMPGLRLLEAVREGRVHVLDASLFNRPGPRLTEAVRALARAIHPEAMVR